MRETRKAIADAAALAKEAVKLAAHLRRGENVDTQVLIGPIVWQPCNNKAGKWWYFIAVTADRSQARLDQLGAEEEQTCEGLRLALIAALVARYKPLVIHDIDDELQLAQMAETLWPSPKTKQILTNIEAERATKH